MDPTVKYITNSLLHYMSSSQNIDRSLIDKARKFVESRFEEPIKNTVDEPAVIMIREIIIEFFSEVYAKQLREELDRTIMQDDVVEPNTDSVSTSVAKDLVAQEKANSRPRVRKTIKGVDYWCYYLKNIVSQDTDVQLTRTELASSSVLEVGNRARQYQKQLIEQGAYKAFIVDGEGLQTITEQFDKYFISWESYRPKVSPEQYKEAIFLYTVAHIRNWGDHVTVLLRGGHIRMRELSIYHVYLYIYLFMAYQNMPRKLIDKLRASLTKTAELICDYLRGEIGQEGKANGTYEIEYLKLNIFKEIITIHNNCISKDWEVLNIGELSL